MNNKKKMVLGAAFIVAIMALAGIGYAVTTHPDYEGKTDSGTNTYDVDYVVVKLRPADYEGKNFETTAASALYVTYDTVTTYDSNYVITYTWKGSTTITHEVTIEVPTSNAGTVDPDTLKLTAKVDGTITDGYKLQYSSDGNTWEDYNTSTGIVKNNPTTGSAITFMWRAAPNQADITPGTDLTIDMPSATSVVLPKITYTVEATQITA